MTTFLLIWAWLNVGSAAVCSIASFLAGFSGSDDRAQKLGLRSAIWTIAAALLFIAAREA